MLFNLLSDIVKIDEILFVVKSDGATSEIRSNSLTIRQNEKWITIGENEGPAHMHINSEIICSAKFVEEEKPERTSFSVRFFNKDNERVMAAFFTKMYDGSKNLISERKKVYCDLKEKYLDKV